MTHDPNGRVAPPRCEECNVPLTSDEHRADSSSTRTFCADCQLALDPFPAKRKKRSGRPRAELYIAGTEYCLPTAIA